jgi:uncharacterized protein YndB with AHSA1/START domain
MSVKKEASGRRSTQVEVEVPGTPEEVWQAIATGSGISAWFVPAEFEERDGKPVAVKLNFGPGIESHSVVTAWDPPRTFSVEGKGWAPGSPPIADEWTVEARAGGICVVRVVNSLFASTDDWDNQLEGTESGWPGLFRILRIYLTHFRGQRSALMQWIGGLANADDGIGAKRRKRRAALDRPGGRPGGKRRPGAHHPESSQRPVAARQAVGRHRLTGRVQLRRRGDGDAQLLPLRRPGDRHRRPRGTPVASVDRQTLSDAQGVEPERVSS